MRPCNWPRSFKPQVAFSATGRGMRRPICQRPPLYHKPVGLGPANFRTHQLRFSAHSPLGTSSASERPKVTLQGLRSMYKRDEPITVITAHDFPSSHVADQAGMDVVLVGDSLAMVALGMEDTSEVIMEEMLLHCRSVSRGTKSAFTVCLRALSTAQLTRYFARSATFQWAHMKSLLSKHFNLLSDS